MLDEACRATIEAAVAEARAAGAPLIGTEHLLLGALRQTASEVIQVLGGAGVTYEAVVDQHRQIFESAAALRPATGAQGAATTGGPPAQLLLFSPAAATVLNDAQSMAGETVTLTHLVAALLAEEGIASGLIDSIGIARGLPPYELPRQLAREVQALVARTELPQPDEPAG